MTNEKKGVYKVFILNAVPEFVDRSNLIRFCLFLAWLPSNLNFIHLFKGGHTHRNYLELLIPYYKNDR